MLGRREGEGWSIEVAAETRSLEYIGAAPSLLELHRLVTATSAPGVWLTLRPDRHLPGPEGVSAIAVPSRVAGRSASVLPPPHLRTTDPVA
jgi:hypothetical protein